MRFVADAMLGKLAKWLRAVGYDTHYQLHYNPGELDRLALAGRRLITRRRDTAIRYGNAILLHANNVRAQLAELKEKTPLSPARNRWFNRCLICNVLLEKPLPEEARESVPEYVFYRHMAGLRHCPSCKRYYWPGSHRIRMLAELKELGFLKDA